MSQAAEALPNAVDKYVAAVDGWEQIGDKYAEALALTTLGYAKEYLRDNDSLIARERALLLYREINDKINEAVTLTELSLTYTRVYKTDRARESYRQAQAIYQTVTDPIGLAQLRGSFYQTANALQGFAGELFMKGDADSLKEAQRILPIAQAFYIDCGIPLMRLPR